MLSNFPKIYCPFIRKTYNVNKENWEKYGRDFQLRKPSVYLVVNEINPGYKWVLDDPETIAIEKLNGSNIKILTGNGRLLEIQNRMNVIDPLQIIKGKTFILEGVFKSIGKGYILPDGEQAGELIGPKVQGNPYKLNSHLFYPFVKAIKDLKYRSFHEHERSFENFSIWFKDWLPSRFASKRGNTEIKSEGIVFYNFKRKSEKKIYMAKLRRDMFPWFYSDKIEIYGYPDSPK